MFYLFNIVLILLIAMIAWWWANQGVFSALLHLIAVIFAGTVAFAAWEPLARLMLRGGDLDGFAWGVTLLGVFLIVLLITRVAMDKLVPGNVDLPPWANLLFGLPLGAFAGILTMGIFLIGAGHIQSHRELMGVMGFVRSPQTGAIQKYNGLWVPAHEITVNFYNTLSVGSLRSGQPLAHYNPDLDRQAMALLRDSFGSGRGAVAMPPDGARITALLQCDTGDRYIVNVSFSQLARDHGEQLTLASSQVRLIADGLGRSEARTSHPDFWTQATANGVGRFEFDNAAHYISSVPGRESADVAIEFPVDPAFTPKYIQIRGTRYSLPAPTPTVCGQASTITPVAPPPPVNVGSTGQSIQQLIRVTDQVRPISASTNALPAGIKVADGTKKLAEGEGTFRLVGGGRVSRGLLVDGFFAPKGTLVVQLEVRRNGPLDLWGPLAKEVGADASIQLVDANGIPYSPVGYMHLKGDAADVKLVPRTQIRNVSQLPVLPSSGSQSIKLLFNVTEGVTIVGFRWGDVTLGTCRLPVEGK